jgi:hypothetical protein
MELLLRLSGTIVRSVAASCELWLGLLSICRVRQYDSGGRQPRPLSLVPLPVRFRSSDFYLWLDWYVKMRCAASSAEGNERTAFNDGLNSSRVYGLLPALTE